MSDNNNKSEEELINVLKDISTRISRNKTEQMKLYGEMPKALQAKIDFLDCEQDREVQELFKREKIADPAEFFYSHDRIFFRGWEYTNAGLIHHMFLYDLDSKKNISVEILGQKIELEWLTAGKKHFHGILDILGTEKTGAQTLTRNRVLYHPIDLDKSLIEPLQDLVSGKYLFGGRETDIRRLIAKEFGEGPKKSSLADIVNKIEGSYSVHEAAHILLDRTLEIENGSVHGDGDFQADYKSETERFAILSQMAYGPLPAFTLYNFTAAWLSQLEYKCVMEKIISNMLTVIHHNKDRYPNLEKFIKDDYTGRLHYAVRDVFKIFTALEPEQIKSLSTFIVRKLYSPIFEAGNSWSNWGIDLESHRVFLADEKYEPITPTSEDILKSEQ